MGSVGMGLYYKEQLRSRLLYLRQLQNLLELMMSEIGFGRATLPECCRSLAASMPEPLGSCLLQIYQEAEAHTGLEFPRIFAGCMQQCLDRLPLEEGDIRSFLWFTEQIGLQDKEMQLKLLGESHQQIHNRIVLEESREQSRGQLAMSLGLMGGLLLIIVFI